MKAAASGGACGPRLRSPATPRRIPAWKRPRLRGGSASGEAVTGIAKRRGRLLDAGAELPRGRAQVQQGGGPLLGIAAAYGALVAVFQWGWGLDAVGLDETVPIVSFLPMMMFAILFGLSMDYEVFILSRVREEWVSTGDPTGSVVGGIATSARVITAAALIMISVFASFVLGDTPEIKMFGFGLPVAVALDATVIRMVLVPASMRLLGDRNWWLPEWLDRFLPNLDLEGEGGLPEPEYEAGHGGLGAVAGTADADPEPDPEPVGAR